MTGSTARVTLMGPERPLASGKSTWAGVSSSKYVAWKLVALLTDTSMRPKRPSAALKAESASADFITRANVDKHSVAKHGRLRWPGDSRSHQDYLHWRNIAR